MELPQIDKDGGQRSAISGQKDAGCFMGKAGLETLKPCGGIMFIDRWITQPQAPAERHVRCEEIRKSAVKSYDA